MCDLTRFRGGGHRNRQALGPACCFGIGQGRVVGRVLPYLGILA